MYIELLHSVFSSGRHTEQLRRWHLIDLTQFGSVVQHAETQILATSRSL
jgi:hypothetical protein